MKIRKVTLSLLATFILLAGWQLFAILMDQPELIPSLPRLIKTLGELSVSGTFYQSIAATVVRGMAGMVLSLFSALGVAWLFARYELLYELFRPLLSLMRSVPVISFILLALIFLNPESIPLMIAFLTMFPLLAENLTKGIKSLHPGFSVMARQFHIKRFNSLSQIIYPQLKPFLYSGLASAVGFGWRAIIMGEVLSQCTFGIGSEMKRAQNFIAVPELLAWTIVAILISFLFDKGISAISGFTFGITFTSNNKMLPTGDNQWIQAQGIGYHYGIFDFTYTFQHGIIYGITAPSGTGKTTLLNLLGGVLPPATGIVRYMHTIGVSHVFQEPELLPHLTALENVALPLSSLFTHEKAIAIAKKNLCDMEMETFGHRYPHELSYGQQQRIAIARALAFPSPVLLMDEPFKGLDKELCLRIMKCIGERQSVEKRIVLFTTHSQEELDQLADEVIHL